jgi:hypothetical protein
VRINQREKKGGWGFPPACVKEGGRCPLGLACSLLIPDISTMAAWVREPGGKDPLARGLGRSGTRRDGPSERVRHGREGNTHDGHSAACLSTTSHTLGMMEWERGPPCPGEAIEPPGVGHLPTTTTFTAARCRRKMPHFCALRPHWLSRQGEDGEVELHPKALL